ncbi:DUF86 domain-containing protein [Asinibacterium sp. OR53]|uniref:HepT-like ribonuclease domain-containing protein n=1 Tax=Asinibacterium sp. OR53 TaxID=925409 RepID=UPI00047B981D|nr:HepT-like ribonuclease domain-containing protein [Asinibacterium sp. OR53]
MRKGIILERLNGISEHIVVIENRMRTIRSATDFTTDDNGSVIFDSILMRLQSIGENIKKIEDLYPGFCIEQLGVEVDKIIRFRDLISYHYELMDTEIIYNIVTEHIQPLKNGVDQYLDRNKTS